MTSSILTPPLQAPSSLGPLLGHAYKFSLHLSRSEASPIFTGSALIPRLPLLVPPLVPSGPALHTFPRPPRLSSVLLVALLRPQAPPRLPSSAHHSSPSLAPSRPRPLPGPRSPGRRAAPSLGRPAEDGGVRRQQWLWSEPRAPEQVSPAPLLACTSWPRRGRSGIAGGVDVPSPWLPRY